jgi:hypothetical protein
MDPNQTTPSPFSGNTNNSIPNQPTPTTSPPVTSVNQASGVDSTTSPTTSPQGIPQQLQTASSTETEANNTLPDLKTAPKQKKSRRRGKFNILGFLWGIIKLPFKILNIFYYIGCVIPLFLIGILSLIIFFQPAFIWNPLKSFVNGDLSAEEYTLIQKEPFINEDTSTEEVQDNEEVTADDQPLNTEEGKMISEIILTELNSEETNMATISEQDLAYLIGNQFELNNTFIDINENEINILINTDKDSPGEPLWVKLKIILEDNKFKLSEANLGRIPLPANVLNSIRVPVLSDFLASGRLTDSEEIFELLLSENISIESTTIIDEEISIE